MTPIPDVSDKEGFKEKKICKPSQDTKGENKLPTKEG